MVNVTADLTVQTVVVDVAVAGVPGPGVPAGGTAGQVLQKAGPDDYAAAWVDPSAASFITGPGFRLVGAELRYDIASLPRG